MSYDEYNRKRMEYEDKGENTMPKRLTRSIRDRKVAGVLGGIAEYFNIDSTIVRLAFVILLITSFFTLTLIYLLAVFIMPNDGEVY